MRPEPSPPTSPVQKLAGIRTLVLDEADQLLEMGFRPAIEKILGQLPRQRQTLLFRRAPVLPAASFFGGAFLVAAIG